MASAMNSIPVIPSPTFSFTSQQETIISQSSGTTSLPDSTGATTSTTERDGPPTQGQTATGVNPESLPAGTDPYTNFLKNCQQVLGEAQGGAWQGTLGNTNIQKMLSTTGVPSSVISQTAWCATFVGYMLKISGLPFSTQGSSSNMSVAAGDYRSYGQAIDINQPHLWRKGDIIVPTRPGSGPAQPPLHVAFLWGIGNDNVNLFGGNQGGKVQSENWYAHTLSGTGGYKIVAVRRNWTIPTSLDTPLI